MKRLVVGRVLRDLGRRVAELRAGRSLTQEALAETLGVTPRYLQRVEAGEENLTLGTLVGFANALGAPLAEFLVPPVSRAVRVGRPPRKKPDSPAPAPAGRAAAAPRPRKPRSR